MRSRQDPPATSIKSCQSFVAFENVPDPAFQAELDLCEHNLRADVFLTVFPGIEEVLDDLTLFVATKLESPSPQDTATAPQ